MAMIKPPAADAAVPTRPASLFSFASRPFWATLASVALAVVMIWNFGATARRVVVQVDGYADQVTTHRTTVADLLDELGLALDAADWVVPPLTQTLASDMTISVTRARPILLSADGQERLIYVHADRVGDIWAVAGVTPQPNDERDLDGASATDDTPLPPPATITSSPRFRAGRPWQDKMPAPVALTLHRALALTVSDQGVPISFMTTAPTVGEALHREQFALYLGDVVRPSLGSPMRAGLHVFIERSQPISISADGVTLKTRTRQATVGAALAEQGILLTGLDQVEPALTTPLVANLAIRIVRVREELVIEQQIVSFTSLWVGDPNLDIDLRRVQTAGQEGIQRQRYRVRYEENVETARALEDDWIAQEPITRVIAYGQRITPQTLETPDGPITYWRKMRVYTTSYTAASAGVPRSAPYYGRTRIGLPLQTGIVAVDPTVIPLRSWLYVPGYGKAIAGDTGGGVKGKFVDLGYSEGEYKSWHWWTDVYLLWPPPPTYQIRWVLPDWPKYPDRKR